MAAIQRIKSNLEEALKSQNYYEAHQIFKTLYFRYKRAKKFTECVNCLFDGAVIFYENHQYESGFDLSMLLVASLSENKLVVTNVLVDKIITLHRLMPNSVDRINFRSQIIKWSCSDSCTTGDIRLHQAFAHTLWKEKIYDECRQHFLYANDGENFGLMLVEYHLTLGLSSETDMFVTQAVLQFLCLSNFSCANSVFTSYTKHHPDISKGPPFVLPLLNFTWFLLFAVERREMKIYTILLEHYKPSINRDPTYIESLERIACNYFGLPPPKQNKSFMSAIFDSLFTSPTNNDGSGEPMDIAKKSRPTVPSSNDNVSISNNSSTSDDKKPDVSPTDFADLD